MTYTSAVEEIVAAFLAQPGIKEGYTFYEHEDQHLVVDDGKRDYFYLRELPDGAGENVDFEKFELHGGQSHFVTIGHFKIVFALDCCYDLDKTVAILIWILTNTTVDLVIPRGLGTDNRSIFKAENGEELQRTLPFQLIKITFDIRSVTDLTPLCDLFEISKDNLC